MKSYIRPQLTKRELKAVAEYTDRKIERGICHAQWLMLVAFNNVLGIGKTRAERVLEEYVRLLDEYKAYQADGVEDEILLKRVRQIGLEVDRLYMD